MHNQAGINKEDEQLVKAVIAGDREAFRIVIQRYEKLVISIVFKMIGSREDREDICQEVFISVYEKLPGFRFQSKLGTWIGNIAFNKAVNLLQRNNYRITDELHNDAEETAIPVENFTVPGTRLERNEQGRILEECMLALSPFQRMAIQLFHYDDCSLDEIGAIMDVPVNTVKSHLNRGRKLLKQLFLKKINE